MARHERIKQIRLQMGEAVLSYWGHGSIELNVSSLGMNEDFHI